MTLIHGRKIAPLSALAIAGAVACGGSGYNSKANQPSAIVDTASNVAPKPSIGERCANRRKGLQFCLLEEATEDCKEIPKEGKDINQIEKELVDCVHDTLPVHERSERRDHFLVISEGDEVFSVRQEMVRGRGPLYFIDTLEVAKISGDGIELSWKDERVDVRDISLTKITQIDERFRFGFDGNNSENVKTLWPAWIVRFNIDKADGGKANFGFRVEIDEKEGDLVIPNQK